MLPEVFKAHVARWGLIAEGEPIETLSSILYFVTYKNTPAVLKIFKAHSDEKNSARILAQYNGLGAVKLLENSDEAVLIDRVAPGYPLTNLVLESKDDEATRIFCDVAKKLHATKYTTESTKSVAELTRYYDKYLDMGDKSLNIDTIKKAKAVFENLCATQKRKVLLHGDLHHENILYDEAKGWLSIDPIGYIGEPEFEAAAFLKNPKDNQYYADEKIVRRRIEIISEKMNLDATRILAWTFSYYVISTIWKIEDGVFTEECFEMLRVLEKIYAA